MAVYVYRKLEKLKQIIHWSACI